MAGTARFIGQIAAVGRPEADFLRSAITTAMSQAAELGASDVEWASPTTLSGLFENLDLVGFAINFATSLSTSLLASFLFSKISKARPAARIEQSGNVFKITVGNSTILVSKVEEAASPPGAPPRSPGEEG